MMGAGTFTTADGLRLAYEDQGEGRPFFWQHGLGADRNQPGEVFPEQPGWRRITLECRGHGLSELGEPARLSIDRFARDLLELAAHLGLTSFVAGGISMGAAIALRVAVLHPEKVEAAVFARPAWLTEAAPANMRIYLDVAALLDTHGKDEGASRFVSSDAYRALEAESPDNAQSLRWFFDRSRADSTVTLLSRIALDGPGVTLADLGGISAPVLVIGNGGDHVHPLGLARQLAQAIPGARMQEITGKSASKSAYVSEFRQALADFLRALEPAAE